MLPSHPIALRAGASLLLSTLSIGTLLGLLLLAPLPLPSLALEASRLRLTMMMTGFVGMAMGGVLGWMLRQALHPEQPHPLPVSLTQENARLRDQVQAAFELVGVAAHDLGNPLTSLHLRLHRLRGQMPPDAPALEGLAKAEREARRMGLMVNELLDLSRLSAGRLDLEPRELDLAALLREVAERFADQATGLGSALVVHAPGPVRGRWDRQRLDRVVTNLLSNALKFGQGRPIELHVLAEDSRIRLSVCDHGMGIPPEAQERLFSRFERLGDTGRPGAGLGLYIVRQLVEAHGGTVHVSSRPGEGSTFTVELPQSSS